MRLTLRTLLAWMDDTLPPSKVREIGNQVGESPFAQELVERIRRVTRQRRLTVPKTTGNEAIDPNLEASYLDNDLDADQVAEVEKQCLSHDVCLAEVASVHQILSLLGQRAKVPTEVKERMYLLVKGREAIPNRHREAAESSKTIPVVNPVHSWVDNEASARPRRERSLLLAGYLTAFLVLGASAWYSLSPTAPVSTVNAPAPEDQNLNVQTGEGEIASQKAEDMASVEDAHPDLIDATTPKQSSDAMPPTELAANTPAPDAKSLKPGESTPATPSALQPGAVGASEKSDQILLRYSDEQREWERLTGPVPLNPSDRLISLAPFQASLDLASIRLLLMAGSEIRLDSLGSAGTSRLELRQGQLKATKSPRGNTLILDLKDKASSLTVDLSETNSVGIERLIIRPAGDSAEGLAHWAIYCQDGTLNVSQSGQKKSFPAPVVITVNSAGTIEQRAGESPPAWVAGQEQIPADRQIQQQFFNSFHDGRPILADLVAATEDSQDSIRRLAIKGLATLGDLSYVMPLLDRKDAPEIRRATIAALRDFISLGGDAAQQARSQILEEFGETTGPAVEKMLRGYTPADAADLQVLKELVGYLEPETLSVGVRELSIETLTKLTKRDRLGYDPDQPEGPGLANWKKLLNEGKLVPDAAVPAEQ